MVTARMTRSLLSMVLCAVLLWAGSTAALAEAAGPSAAATEDPFDPSLFGRVLTDAEIDAVDGQGAWLLVAGALLGAVSHIALHGVDVDSPEWWLGLAVSVALGAIPGVF